MKKILAILCIFICLLIVTACSSDKIDPETLPGDWTPESLENAIAVHEEFAARGYTVYSESGDFMLTVLPTRIIDSLAEDGRLQRRLVIEYQVVNISENTFRNFSIEKETDIELDPYLAATGLFPPFGPVDRFPKRMSVHMTAEPLITSDESLAFAMIEYDIREHIMKYAQEFTLHLSWRGGSESVRVFAPVIDETQ